MANATPSGPPFRADHVGSLRRPQSLMEARERLLGAHDLDDNFGPHDNAELRALEDEAIRDAVALQEGAGLHAITDGEFRRRIWWSEFIVSLDGVDGNYRGNPGEFQDAKGHKMPKPRIDVTGKIAWRESVNVEPFRFLASVTGQTPKVTIPAPQMIYFYTSDDSIDRTVYPNLDSFWSDVADAYVVEIKALAEAGCTYVQLDEVVTTCMCDDKQRDALRQRGEEPDTLIDRSITAINAIADACPPSMTLAMHTCRGNFQGHWLAEGGYDPIAEKIFGETKVKTFFLEYDTERAGTFEPLRFVPKDKYVALGLVSTKTPELEDEDFLKARIDQAAKFLPVENLCLSPQCGFSSNYLGNPVTIDDERRKLELVVRTATDVWGTA